MPEWKQAISARLADLMLGMSFGTQIALATVRRHGGVHRVVLAGPQGPDDNLVLPFTFDLLLKKLPRLAAADATLNKSVPDLEALVKQVLDQVDKKPITLTVTDRFFEGQDVSRRAVSLPRPRFTSMEDAKSR